MVKSDFESIFKQTDELTVQWRSCVVWLMYQNPNRTHPPSHSHTVSRSHT